MKRVYFDQTAVDPCRLAGLEQPATVGIKLLGGVPDLEHVHIVVLAIGGVELSSLWVPGARGLELIDQALVIAPRHLLRAYVDGYRHLSGNFGAALIDHSIL